MTGVRPAAHPVVHRPVASPRSTLSIEMVVIGLIRAGLENVVARLSRGLALRGHRVGITCIEFEGALGEELRNEGFRVTVVPTPGKRTILFPADLTRWLRDAAPDVVHTHTGAWIKGARAAALAGIRSTVHTIHGLLDVEPWHGPPLKWWAGRSTAAIAAVSDPLRRYLIERAHIPAARVELVPNGVDTAAFSPGPGDGVLRAALGVATDRVVIGHVGRFAPVKNHGDLLRAFARVHAAAPEAFLMLVGDGELRDDIERQIDALALRDHVALCGELADLPPAYREFDVFTLPSHAEGTSMSVLEAMATGLPIVASAVGGTPDLLGDAGELVPPRDPAALADALLRLTRDAGRRADLGRRARARVVAGYGFESMLDAYERLYDRALEAR